MKVTQFNIKIFATTTLALAALAIVSFTTPAFGAAKPSTLLKEVVAVGFAPPQYRGIFTVEILSNGNVQFTGNKGNKVVHLKLSKDAVAKIKTLIAQLEVSEMYGDEGPGCADAPSRKTYVVKDKAEILIGSTVNCLKSRMGTAWELNGIMDAASALNSSLR